MKHCFDIIVVGAGHAGCEAAHAAWRMGRSVAMVTFRSADIGVMSCNPAIGGVGKGHLVREIDAMGGLMGLVADRAGIQFRLLNRSKGPAVQGPRLQADRAVYHSEMVKRLTATDIEVLQAEVVDLHLDAGGRVVGVVLRDGSIVGANRVIIATGTFLGGVLHIGDCVSRGGRAESRSANRLAARLRDLGLPIKRLRTGTPPRLLASSIRWDSLERQPGDDDPALMSFLSSGPTLRQIECGIAHTNELTHEIIRRNLSRSASYGGAISGVGPRYCPSVEDKVVRFAEKTSHQVFLEPEGLTSELVYPNGISTSLPADVQEAFVRSIYGLDAAVIQRPGYAIEYDFVDPTALDRSLQLRALPNVYLAGQINGTTGYEEAAAQGLVAGLNAALAIVGREPWLPLRSDGYLGVLVDDLVTRGVSEPYRMFTSRAEYRLVLRADNADERLTPIAASIGCIDDERRRTFGAKRRGVAACRRAVEKRMLSLAEQRRVGLKPRAGGPAKSAFEALGLVGCQPAAVCALFSSGSAVQGQAIDQVSRDAIYHGYVGRQDREIAKLRNDEDIRIPPSLSFETIRGLSTEITVKLECIRPESLAQAARIDGMTPDGLLMILAAIKGCSKSAA